MSRSYYLAGRFSRKDDLAGKAAAIVRHGGRVNARWLTGAHDATSEQVLTHEDLRRFAREDIDDVVDSNTFILFTETPDVGYMSGGRMVEFGIALNDICFQTVIVGPYENIFTRLADRQFDTWEAFLADEFGIEADHADR